MSAAAFTHFILVDFENVPDVDLSTIRGQPVHVTLLFGKNQKKIELELVKQIQAFAAQVSLVEVGATGHNALDLTLACYLGRAIDRSPAANFAIVSKDKDFAPMIAHLCDHDIEVVRYDSFASLPFLPHRKTIVPAKSSAPKQSMDTLKTPPESRRAKVIAHLKNSAAPNRPATEKSLHAHIKTALGKQASVPEVDYVVNELRKTGTLIIDAKGKVSYP